jgi:hypothetical protein
MTKGVSLATLAVIIHGAFLFLPFAVAQNSTQELMEMLVYQDSQSTLNEQKFFRPSPQEREAINKLIDMKPRPKTFNEADVTYLKALLKKAAWLGSERRIMHEMWAEVTGKQWGASDGNTPKQPEGTQ